MNRSEDYLYPANRFIMLELPEEIRMQLLAIAESEEKAFIDTNSLSRIAKANPVEKMGKF